MDRHYADRIEIQDVLLKYAAGIDEKHDQLLRSCFADDVIAPGFLPQAIRGIEAMMEYLQAELAPFSRTQHMLGPVLATIDGDTAQARTDLQAMHLFREPEGKMLLVWGTYNTGLVRRNGVWLIARHELVVWKSTTR